RVRIKQISLNQLQPRIRRDAIELSLVVPGHDDAPATGEEARGHGGAKPSGATGDQDCSRHAGTSISARETYTTSGGGRPRLTPSPGRPRGADDPYHVARRTSPANSRRQRAGRLVRRSGAVVQQRQQVHDQAVVLARRTGIMTRRWSNKVRRCAFS